MADTKTSALASLGTPVGADYFFAVLASGPTDKKLLLSDLMKYVIPAFWGSEIAVTGATTATINKMHVCTGTSADYTLTLPAASGNAGALIGVRMGSAAALTKLVTIDGNSAETIDGALTRIMWAMEAAILLCDGSNWFKISGKSIPMVCTMERSTDQTGVVTATVTKVALDTIADDSAGMGDTGNARINIKRPGTYLINGAVTWSALGNSVRTFTQAQINGSAHFNAEGSASSGSYMAAFGVKAKTAMEVANAVTIHGYHNVGSNQTIYGASGVTFLSVVEVPAW